MAGIQAPVCCHRYGRNFCMLQGSNQTFQVMPLPFKFNDGKCSACPVNGTIHSVCRAMDDHRFARAQRLERALDFEGNEIFSFNDENCTASKHFVVPW